MTPKPHWERTRAGILVLCVVGLLVAGFVGWVWGPWPVLLVAVAAGLWAEWVI